MYSHLLTPGTPPLFALLAEALLQEQRAFPSLTLYILCLSMHRRMAAVVSAIIWRKGSMWQADLSLSLHTCLHTRRDFTPVLCPKIIRGYSVVVV